MQEKGPRNKPDDSEGILREQKIDDAKQEIEGIPGFKPNMYEHITPEGDVDWEALADQINQEEG